MARPGESGGVLLVGHPVVDDLVSRLRDATTPSDAFRRYVGELSYLVAYEALRGLETSAGFVDTPVATGAPVRRLSEAVLLVPVLRAGLGMIPALQDLLPHAQVAHVGLRRDEVTHESEVYLNRLPEDLSARRVLVCDPMLATGGSLAQACDLAVRRDARDLMAICLIASRPGLGLFASRHPGVRVACAAIDETLDDRAYIVPGLGDAGDRMFGPPD